MGWWGFAKREQLAASIVRLLGNDVGWQTPIGFEQEDRVDQRRGTTGSMGNLAYGVVVASS